jgi:hypothetical protein
LSPRDTKGALRPRCGAGQALEDVLARRLGRVGLRADDDEVVVHHLLALDAEAFGDEFLLGRLVMHEDDVGIAAPRHVQRLAGAQRDDAHLDAAGLLEGRQQVAEQTRLLGRGGRGDGDEALLGGGQAGASRPVAARAEQNRRRVIMGFPPEESRCAASDCGELKKTADRRLFDDAAAVDENDVLGEAARLAEVVGGHQDACTAGGDFADDAFHLAAAARIEAGGRLVEDQQFRLQRPGARQRHALLLAAGQQPCRALRQVGEADAVQRGSARGVRSRYGHGP